MLLNSIVIVLTLALGVAIVAFYGKGPTTMNPEERVAGRSGKSSMLLNSTSSKNVATSKHQEEGDTSKVGTLITAR